MPKIENSLVINAPIEKVWAYLDDISNASKYSESVIEAKKLTDGPTAIGTKYLYVAKFMGQKMETKGEITAHDPPHKSAWKGVDSPFPMQGATELESVAGGTRVTQRVDATPGGFFKLAEPLLMKQFQSQGDADLTKLKQILEAGG